jgi:hypothetical protein
MGASSFAYEVNGKNLVAAYDAEVREALYMSGHDSYNGTISTTQGIVDCDRIFPKGMRTNTKIKLAHRALRYIPDPQEWDAKTHAYVHTSPEKQDALKGLSEAHRALVKRIYNTGIDKWGPAGGFKLAPNRFYLFGWAAE